MWRIIWILIVVFFLAGGTGICKWEDPQALDDLVQAARQGDADAMCDLALAYYNGDGVLKDPFKAKCWVKQAHDLGSKRAERIWNRLKLWQYSGKCSPGFDDHARQAHQARDRYREPVTGMTFVWLPGKCFKMGCNEREDRDCGKDESPAHKVCIDGFWMGEYEVTQAQWTAVMDRNPSRFRGSDRPVEQVSFEDAITFVQKLNRITGRRFSLPTEAQWEFACRNRGRHTAFPWGRDEYQPSANCGGCDAGRFRGQTAPVGSFLPNEAGLYDMGGNVREWCRDVYDRDTYARKTGQSGKKRLSGHKKSGRARVVRGGSFVDPVSASRCRARSSFIPQMKAQYIGFRVVLKKRN